MSIQLWLTYVCFSIEADLLRNIYLTIAQERILAYPKDIGFPSLSINVHIRSGKTNSQWIIIRLFILTYKKHGQK